MHRVGGLVVAFTPQAVQRHADKRRQREARGFDEPFGGLHYRLGSDARSRDLRHGIQQQAARGVGQATAVELTAPGLEAVAQVVHHTSMRGIGQRFAAELLQPVEDQSLGGGFWRQCGVSR